LLMNRGRRNAKTPAGDSEESGTATSSYCSDPPVQAGGSFSFYGVGAY
jgi:hypothetical protein